MATTVTELLGEQIIEHDQIAEQTEQTSTNQLDGKILGLYFSSVYFGLCVNLLACLFILF